MLRKKLNLLEVGVQNDADASCSLVSKKARFHNAPSISLDLSYTNCDQDEKSNYFPSVSTDSKTYVISHEMIKLQRCLNDELEKINFSKDPIRYIYNPTIYASEPCVKYLELYCHTKKKIIFLGMNPGPWGMCQTGVPFGDVTSVKNWLQIEGKVSQPDVICNEKQIEGFSCKRKEISGDRFWNFFKKLCESPDIFFKNSIVYNYCPLAFMKINGGNITPPEIEISLKIALEEACDRSLIEVITLLKPEFIIGIGRYAEKRAKVVLKQISDNVKVLYMPHPSPRSAQSNNWSEKTNAFLNDYKLMHYFQ